MVKTRNESFASDSPLAPRDPLGSIPLVDDPGKSTESREAGLDSGTASKPDTHDYLTGVKLFMVILSLTLATFLLLLDSSIVATAIPYITGDFHSLDDQGWYGTSYLLANCAFQPLSGKIYTFFNVKWTFLIFFAVFELGSVLCGAATSSTMLIIGRAVAGLGASGLLNGGYTMIALIVPVARQAGLRGILMGLSFFGLLAGPLIGGALTEYSTWRWCFYINLPCGFVIGLSLVLVSIPDERVSAGKQPVIQRIRKLDLFGFLLFSPAVVMLILALQWGGVQYSWNSATIIGLFCGSFGNLVVFLIWEHHVGAEAMIPLFLLRRRIIWSSCLNMACFIGCTFTTAYYFPIYFQAVKGESPLQSGVGLLPQIVTNMIVTIFTGALVGRVGYYLPFALASGVFTSIGTGLVTTLTPTSPTSRRVGFQILQGFQGLGFQIPILAVQNGVRREEVSVATALVVFSQNLGGAVFLSLAEVIFSNRLRHFLSVYAPGVNADALVAAGASATNIKDSLPADLLPAIRLAYSKTFDNVMYLGTGAAVAAFMFATGMGWVRIRTTRDD